MVDIKRFLLTRERHQVERYLTILADLSDTDKAPEIVRKYHAEGKHQNIDAQLAGSGLFDFNALQMLVFSETWSRFEAGGISGEILLHILNVLEDNLMSSRSFQNYYQLKPIIKIMNESGNLIFSILGFPHVAEIMKDAVAAINIVDDQGNESCGSGIILHSDQPGMGLVVTNSHIFDFGKIKEVVVNGNCLNVASGPTHCGIADLAKFNVNLLPSIPKVGLALDVNVLDQVVAMGFPRVPTATSQFLTAHSGEVNASFETFDRRQFIAISCHVSPGNSGGPIFNRFGYCSGIVTQSGTAEFGANEDPAGIYKSTYHMAIPVEIIREFVSPSGGS